ncbi:hypothetical protein EV141_2088 [Microcella putealis]|uniref:Uncharacterized protein n=1 Tax=Microcella putealis TaxID=337005 RepID=A0A4Q7LLS0_9MICO|nr:hypothetical protein EV141_2088 [Microcella putealis]TQM19639.1 hypothetical protein BJ957_2466 [Microcella putealis]
MHPSGFRAAKAGDAPHLRGAPAHGQGGLALQPCERLLDVGDEVGRVLNADR